MVQGQRRALVAIADPDRDLVVAGSRGRLVGDRRRAVALDLPGIDGPLEILERKVVLLVFDAERERLARRNRERGRAEADQARRRGLLAASRESQGDDREQSARHGRHEVEGTPDHATLSSAAAATSRGDGDRPPGSCGRC
jgi:hypothetical protein